MSLSRGHVLGDVPLWIDDQSDTSAGASDEIGGAGAPLVQELPEDHVLSPLRRSDSITSILLSSLAIVKCSLE